MPFKYLENINHIWEFREAKRDVLKAQRRLLFNILEKNKNTVYGKRYGFKKIRSLADFQKNVPVISFEDLSHLVERIKRGEKNILTKDKVIYFATTSGSTNKPKLIPVTRQRIVSFKKELSLWSFKFLRMFPEVLKGKLLYFAGPYDEGRTQAGIMYGSISGFLAYRSSWFVKRKLVVPPRLYNELDFDKKIREIAKLAIRSKVTQLGFAFPIEVLLFFDFIKKNKKSLIAAIRDEGHWFKARILEKKEFTPQALWPKLRVINCIKSQQNKYYIDEIEALLPDVLINDPGIYSSEGRLSLCISPGSLEGLLPVTINFFEFKEIGSDKILLADEVKIGEKYEVIMTTREGLYRYAMGDVVEIAGFKDSIPLIKFYERTNYLNIAGELAHENVLIDSMDEVLDHFNVSLRAFTFMPLAHTSNSKSKYNVLIEPRGNFTEDFAKRFIKKLDGALKKNIRDYKQMREEFGRIGFPVLSVAKKGCFDNFDKKRLSSGGQQKPVIIAKDFNFINNFDLEFQIKS